VYQHIQRVQAQQAIAACFQVDLYWDGDESTQHSVFSKQVSSVKLSGPERAFGSESGRGEVRSGRCRGLYICFDPGTRFRAFGRDKLCLPGVVGTRGTV
jgi:hypothetical protein